MIAKGAKTKGCRYPSSHFSVEYGLELVVEDEHESSTGSSEDVGKATLEESSWTLVLEDLFEVTWRHFQDVGIRFELLSDLVSI